MAIKHSKIKNTGLIFEILVKQIASDTLSGVDSPAITILKEYYAGKSPLAQEFKLYQFLTKNKNVSQSRAEAILSTILEASRSVNQKALKEAKYNLVAEIKRHYQLEEFFGVQVKNYKPLAALYCILEEQTSAESLDINSSINNKTTILEHLTSTSQKEKANKNELMEEYAKEDLDVRILTLKILLEKFNSKYRNLLPEQKAILKEFITSTDSTVKLRGMLNEELLRITKELALLSRKVVDEVTRIKIDEIRKNIKPISIKEKVLDESLANLMQYYDLVHELKSLK